MAGLLHIRWRCCIPQKVCKSASEWKEASSLPPLSKKTCLSSCGIPPSKQSTWCCHSLPSSKSLPLNCRPMFLFSIFSILPLSKPPPIQPTTIASNKANVYVYRLTNQSHLSHLHLHPSTLLHLALVNA